MVDGVRGLAIDVVKAQDSNTIQVVDNVRRVVDELRKSLPADVKLTIVRDTSLGIRNSVNNVRRSIIEGAALTILIVWVFLRSWRSTVITGLTLPIALIGTFTAMQVLGYTLNMMTLMAHVAVRRPADRRRHRRAREHRAPPEHGQGPPRGRARRHARDRARGDGHHVHHLRGVHSGGVHGRHHRPLLLLRSA